MEFCKEGTSKKSFKCFFHSSSFEESRCLNIRDLQSIGLVGSFYKIQAKVLADRLQRVVGKLVSDFRVCIDSE